MRLKRHNVTMCSGAAIICDPQVVAGCEPAGSAVIRLWEGNGEFVVYSRGQSYFVDVDPRIFKTNTRSGLTALPGRVCVDSSHIGIYDLSDDIRLAALDTLEDGRAIQINGLANGDYVAWFEEKGTAKDVFRGVVGFGRQPVMLLNGDHAGQLQELEDRIARAYRLKGREKQSEMKEVSDLICDLHLDGCKDKRLRMLADAVKLKLPRRTARRGAS